MSTTIGAVDFIVGLDGRTMPTQARAIGERIGAALAAAANRQITKQLGAGVDRDNKALEMAGENLGRKLADALGGSFNQRMIPALSRAGDVVRRGLNLDPVLEDIGELKVVSREAADRVDDLGDSAERSNTKWGRFRSTLRTVGLAFENMNFAKQDRDGRGFERTVGAIGRSLAGMFKGVDFSKFGSMLGELNDGWKNMTHGVRQAIFYVALFASLATQIAVLGSAAGVALTILAGALVSVALAGGAAILLFQGLTGELSELDPAIQPAVAAFRAIGDAFGAMQTQIQASVLPALIPSFEALKGLVETLTPGMVNLAGSVGKVIEQLVQMLTSTNGLEVLNGLIAGAAPIFELLASAAFNLGGALGNIFLIAQPYIETFAGWLNTILTEFNNWTQSVAGNQAITQWLENGMTVLSALGDLVVQVSDFMAQLVTPDTIQGLLTFMEIIGGALQPLGDFLLALEKFQIFNIIAQLISTVFTALQPLMPAFGLLGELLSGLIITALQAITPLLTILVEAFAALVEPLVGALMPILPIFAELIGQTALMFQPLLEALVLLGTTIGEAIAPILTIIVDLFFRLIEALMPLVAAVIPPLVEIITVLAAIISETLAPILPLLVEGFVQILDAIIPIIPSIVELMESILSLITPLLELITPILPPLTELLKFLISASIVPLTAAIQFLTPVLKGLADGISSFVMPIIEGLKVALKGLGDFITGVFSGNLTQAGEGLKSFFNGIGQAILGGLKGLVNGAVDIINGLIGGINNLTGAVGIPSIPKIPKWAKGGIAWQSMIANIGEDGPEMIVPLRRPLGMIDPAVRDVAAYAQGKSTGNGGGGGGGTVIENVEVNVYGTGDERRTAVEVVDRMVEVAA